MAKKAAPPIISDHPLASFDLGNAGSKIKTVTVSTEFRSIMGRLSRGQMFGDIKSPLAFSFEGQSLIFGDDSRDLTDAAPTAFTDMARYTSGFYRKLFAAALWLSFKDIAADGIVYPIIVCSIPVSEYADGKADEVKENIIDVDGQFEICGLDGKLILRVVIQRENLIVIPEGAGAYFQALYAPQSKLADQEVAVLDIGFYTTDLTIWNKGKYVMGSAKSGKHGVRQVASAVYTYLRKEHAFEGDEWAVDSALDGGAIEIGNTCVPLVNETHEAYADLLEDLFSFYRSSKGGRTPAAVVMAGGGAAGCYQYLGDSMKAAGWRVIGEPRRANAEGGYMFLLKRQEKEKVTANAK